MFGNEEEDRTNTTSPSDDAEAAEELDAQELTASDSLVALIISLGLASIEDSIFNFKECKSNASHYPAAAMHLECLKWIIDLEFVHHEASDGVGDGADHADDDGGPGLNGVATGGDANEASENAVGQGLEVHADVFVFSCDVLSNHEG